MEVLLLLDIALNLHSGQRATLTHTQFRKCPVKTLLGKYHLPTKNLTKPAPLRIFRGIQKCSVFRYFAFCCMHSTTYLKNNPEPFEWINTLSSFCERASFHKTKRFYNSLFYFRTIFTLNKNSCFYNQIVYLYIFCRRRTSSSKLRAWNLIKNSTEVGAAYIGINGFYGCFACVRGKTLIAETTFSPPSCA